MMAVIISRGTLPADVWYVHTCSNCSTKFKFQYRELEAGAEASFKNIECPLCEKQLRVYVSYLTRYTDSGSNWITR